MSVRRPAATRVARAAAVLTAVGALVGLATPAHAVVLDTDRPHITAQELDFGTNWFAGAPLNGGFLNWDVTSGVVTPILTGNLYINNASGTCARMQMVYWNGTTKMTTKNGALKCANDGSLHTFSINMSPFADKDITKVTVRLQVQNTNGTFTGVGAQDWLLG